MPSHATLSPRRSPSSASTYKAIAHSAKITPVRKCVDGKVVKPRNYNGRIFPKSQIRQLAYKAGFARVRGIEGDENAYDYIDEKMFLVLEKALRDAEAIADVAGIKTIKERHVVMALERYGVIGIGSSEARRDIAKHKYAQKA